MTFRTAVVISKQQKGDSPECSGPGRVVYEFVGHNCSTAEFVEWLQISCAFEEYLFCPDNKLISLGAEPALQEGQIISVSFEDYFDRWLNGQLNAWRQDADSSW